MHKPVLTSLPDVAVQKVNHQDQSINWVGMGGLRLPLILTDGNIEQHCNTNCEVFVNLAAGAMRGIHMSRLFLLSESLTKCDKPTLQELLYKFVDTHKEISDAAKIKLSFDLMLRRPALISNNSGWRAYPVELEVIYNKINGQTEGIFSHNINVDVLYSSTCPCSKALAEQVIVDKFSREMNNDTLNREEVMKWLQENALYATPHSQRSSARVSVAIAEGKEWGIEELITLIENKLQTAVQSAVKREDEQHFAILNGQNPMFCEDAVRILKNALKEAYPAFCIHVEHYESLHAHNAVAMCSYP